MFRTLLSGRFTVLPVIQLKTGGYLKPEEADRIEDTSKEDPAVSLNEDYTAALPIRKLTITNYDAKVSFFRMARRWVR